MKKILLLAALVLFSFANAQKGSYLVSGNVFYNAQKNSNNGQTDYQYIGFNPKTGYQFTDSFTLGIETSFNQNKWTTDVNNYESNSKSFSIGSFLRYSKPLNDSFSLFADLGVGYQNTKQYFSDSINPETKTKANGFYANLQPLIHLKIKNNFGINFGLGGISYNTLNYKESDNKVSSFTISFGQAYTLGIQKTF